MATRHDRAPTADSEVGRYVFRQTLLAKAALFLAVVGFAAAHAALGQEAAPSPAATAATEIPLRDVLVIQPGARWGRSVLRVDPIEALLVAGAWSPPQAGQTLEAPDGKPHKWEAVQAGPDGVIRHAALGGGYVYAAVESDRPRAMWLEAAGHSLVYVNGAPRAGDPYQTGYARLPVLLEKGTNEFLFACGRGELRAKLVEPSAPVALDVRDATLPDLIVGEPADTWAAVVVTNATDKPLTDGRMAVTCGGAFTATVLPSVPACSIRKVGFRVTRADPMQPGTEELELALERGPAAAANVLDRAKLTLRVRRPDESYKRTFISEIDGSVQYFAVQPARPEVDRPEPPALFLTLHGAGVEALGQADAYRGKSWGQVVAPTNRRPFGFDWEDWGRLDALEVLQIAQRTLGTDPQRTYLTGHSMGGHGVWQVGATCPDHFAAIAPSAGWISFWSYAGAERSDDTTPIGAILRRATNPSDTLGLSRNYLHYGIYVLHGENDDNVPVDQARTMRKHLAEYHPNFAYYERPGAGHWWGSECVDWPPLFEFLKQNVRPEAHEVRQIEFVTANPAVSATSRWATIEAQEQSLNFSSVTLTLDPEKRRIYGSTENVARLVLALQTASSAATPAPQYVLPPGEPLNVELDGQQLSAIPWPEGHRLRLERRAGNWSVVAGRPTSADSGAAEDTWPKGPHRAGPFKAAFDQRVQFVYGARGNAEENAWACTKARYDAEMFWYRGNGSVDLVADTDFDPQAFPDRSVILYGNADTNGAWETLFARSPVQVERGRVRVGPQELTGEDLAVLATYPRPGSARAMVGVVSGSGLVGMRLTCRSPYFLSGVGYPDWIVLEPRMLKEGLNGVRAAGFFANDWSVDPQQSAWREP